MGSRTKGGAVVARKPARIVWKDAHQVDPVRCPVAATEGAGEYVAELRAEEPVTLRLVGSTTTPERGAHVTRWEARAEWGGSYATPIRLHSLALARACVDRVLARMARGEELADAWAAEFDANAVEGRASAALDEIEMCYPILRREEPSGSLLDSTARCLRTFAREMARRGFVFGPGGRVTQTWRARARGTWLDWTSMLRPEDAVPFAEATNLVRVEGGKTLEIHEENDGEWTVEIDGERVAAELPTRAEAMRYALEQVGVKDRWTRRQRSEVHRVLALAVRPGAVNHGGKQRKARPA